MSHVCLLLKTHHLPAYCPEVIFRVVGLAEYLGLKVGSNSVDLEVTDPMPFEDLGKILHSEPRSIDTEEKLEGSCIHIEAREYHNRYDYDHDENMHQEVHESVYTRLTAH